MQLLIKRDLACADELGTCSSLTLTDKLSVELTCPLFQVLFSTKGTTWCFLLGWSHCKCNYATSGEDGIFSKMEVIFKFE